MPIIDVEIVGGSRDEVRKASADRIASAAAMVFESPKGQTWVRLRTLDGDRYAENDAPLGPDELPVFVTVLVARPPVGADLAAQVDALTGAIAAAVDRPRDRVHVEYAPPGAGRLAFGGTLTE